MEVFVSAPSSRFSNSVFPDGSVVRDVLTRFVQTLGLPSDDFYVITNGRRSDLDDPLQHGAVYHLEPRLRGGKGGFGSMLRALGAQIEKTTNREACRDLSGRRLRDVNHEKEMAEWLKKQAEREAEKEQRRLERLQRKLAEPKHQFTDPEFQQQCHDLSERLEDSVLKGLQASSGGQVKVDDVSGVKRANTDQSQQPQKKMKTAGAACFWSGLNEQLSSDDDEESPSTSSSSCRAAAVTVTRQMEEDRCSSSPASDCCSPSTHQNPAETSTDQNPRPPENQNTAETSTDQNPRPPENQNPAETSTDQNPRPPENQNPAETSTDQNPRPLENQNPAETSTDQNPRPPENQNPAETSTNQNPEEPSCSSQQQRLPPPDLTSAVSAEQLEALGLGVLKEELMQRGLKCGGTLSERAARLFSVRGLSPDQIDPALLAKPGKTRKK